MLATLTLPLDAYSSQLQQVPVAAASSSGPCGMPATPFRLAPLFEAVGGLPGIESENDEEASETTTARSTSSALTAVAAVDDIDRASLPTLILAAADARLTSRWRAELVAAIRAARAVDGDLSFELDADGNAAQVAYETRAEAAPARGNERRAGPEEQSSGPSTPRDVRTLGTLMSSGADVDGLGAETQPSDLAATKALPVHVATSRLVLNAPGWQTIEPVGSWYTGPEYNTVEENPKLLLAWYRLLFLGAPHANFVADLDSVYVVSVMRTAEGRSKHGTIRAIVWCETTVRRVAFAARKAFRSFKTDLRAALAVVDPNSLYRVRSFFRCVVGPNFVQTLLVLEDESFLRALPIGVVYAHDGQVTRSELLGNNATYPASADAPLCEFIARLGTCVPLLGWDGYPGSLDTENGTSGEHSMFTQLAGKDVMFHVAPLIPNEVDDDECSFVRSTRRKALVSHTPAIIVFHSGVRESALFSPSSLGSQHVHVTVVVSPHPDDSDAYVMQYAHAASIAPFGPHFSSLKVPATQTAVHSMLTNVINGLASARASAPGLAGPAAAFRKDLLDSAMAAVDGSEPGYGVGPPSGEAACTSGTNLPPLLGSALRGPRRSSVMPLAAASDALTVFSAVNALPPGPSAVTAFAPWRNAAVYSDADGIHLLSPDDTAKTTLFGKQADAIYVVHNLGLAVARLCKRKHGVVVLHLTALGKAIVHRLPETKRCEWLAVCQTSHKVVVSVKASLHVFDWVAPAGAYVLDTRINLETAPSFVTFLSTGRLGLAVAGTYLIMHARTGKFVTLNKKGHKLPITPASTAAAAIEISIDTPSSHIFLASGVSSILVDADTGELPQRAAPLCWCYAPTSFVAIDYYILALSDYGIEVRSARNGALVQMITLPQPLALLSPPQLACETGVYVSAGSGTAARVYHISASPQPTAPEQTVRSPFCSRPASLAGSSSYSALTSESSLSSTTGLGSIPPSLRLPTVRACINSAAARADASRRDSERAYMDNAGYPLVDSAVHESTSTAASTSTSASTSVSASGVTSSSSLITGCPIIPNSDLMHAIHLVPEEDV
ncbi:uncharacterized protein AMSG_10380 [Thecamonas trahens ATCC 50062]|uniref:Rap-GAP domain-containing protein n=1 Tax=Thecamonas trahens ATCC 50062 TaxID=461836 RepID=A0A0L0DSV2_THETB|nr:hypothetical protein AMSG_10380 [Thecamonas trahens ATCC 50062]KNC54533.1 hypothetical protein AMSG_10380 [Thecamonas trahens ATCC 50062]|eukprot:XP_013753550.1 hypothetical protein AMSG_10380 [Thecamonas trahens ATCC 50062]